MRIAIIDMGTNTFNLLIAELHSQNGFSIIHHSKLGVMLGKGGINSKIITEKAYSRGMNAIGAHYDVIKQHQVTVAKAFATSAIRTASNGKTLVDEIISKYNIEVEIIDGDREAELIYKGVSASMNIGEQRILVMDIGGGSNEFIICDGSRIYWKQSFPLGMSRLIERFSPSDPITGTETAAIECFLDEKLIPLWNAITTFKPSLLVGSSGSFDTYRNILFYGKDNMQNARNIDLSDYHELHHLFLKSTLQQRLQIKGMDELRAEMIVLASILTNLVLNRSGILKVMQSNFALKEGAVVEIAGNHLNNQEYHGKSTRN